MTLFNSPFMRMVIQVLSTSIVIILSILRVKNLNKRKFIFSFISDSDSVTDEERSKSWIKKLQQKFKKLSKKELLETVEQNQKELHKVTYFDLLTELPNRVKLTKEFEKFLSSQTDNKNTIEVAVYILDIDRFRTINELYGRNAGDEVLIKVTERLRTLLGDSALIARESEDEIYLLIGEISEEESIQVGKDIVDLFSKPFKINNSTLYVTASIGISRYPENAQDMDALLQQAEIAMYKVKQNGKNNFHLFVSADAAAIERKRRIEFGLKEALADNELFLVYQPKVEIQTGNIYGVEALLRWKHPILGLVPPNEFIPIAEESGMINEIGYWVLHEAVRQTKEWHSSNLDLHISINVSPIQFEDPYLFKRVQNVVELYDLDPNYLIIEITETVMKNEEHANRIIRELHDYGVRVAIDDFGTGYSSLSVLNNMFVDMVKIDKSFIEHIVSKANTASLVKTMIQMGKSLNFSIVAEGIESKEQSIFLKDNHCQFGQGYYYSRPVTPEKIVDLINKKTMKD
ncbi:hypothetical protein GCM10008932_13240 [Alkalibacterium iburiense]|uniref:Uncharacterized protein n=1 Tax=Alkalibacterium iburiense TaxID=290589 RepID=A0ABN0XEY1_9LACT